MQAAAFDSQRFAYVLVAALVVGRFLFRELRERKMRVKTVYVLPIIVGAVALYAIGLAYFLVPALVLPLAIGCVSALAVGGAIGVAVAHLTTVRVTDDRSVVYVRGSYATVAIWLGGLALRLAVRVLAFHGSATADVEHFGTELVANAALLIMIGAALFFVRHRVLVAAQLERARGDSLPGAAL